MGGLEWFRVEKSGRADVESRSVESWWCTQCDFGGGSRENWCKDARVASSIGVFRG